jgi:DUF4097 and DUF4098 domain-containing protein YvlB
MVIKILCVGILMIFSFSPLLAQELQDRVQEHFSGVETISVRGAFCKTEIVSGTIDEVLLEGEIRSVRRYQDLRIRYQQNGSLLDVWIEQPNNTSGQIKGLLVLSVPAQTKVQVSNLSGSIRVDGVGRGSTSLETISGDVVVNNHPDSLVVNTSSGNIQGDWISGGVLAQSVSGHITIRNVKGGCHLTSTSGQIRVLSAYNAVHLNGTSGKLSVEDVIGDVKANSVSGQVLVSGLKGSLMATSSSGSITVNRSVGMLDLTTISGSINGKELMITDHSMFKNASGHIEVMLNNDPESLRFDLSTLSGRLEVYGEQSEKQMQWGKGSVLVTGTSTSGNQRYQ